MNLFLLHLSNKVENSHENVLAKFFGKTVKIPLFTPQKSQNLDSPRPQRELSRLLFPFLLFRIVKMTLHERKIGDSTRRFIVFPLVAVTLAFGTSSWLSASFFYCIAGAQHRLWVCIIKT